MLRGGRESMARGRPRIDGKGRRVDGEGATTTRDLGWEGAWEGGTVACLRGGFFLQKDTGRRGLADGFLKKMLTPLLSRVIEYPTVLIGDEFVSTSYTP
jgi:hypothetical protein